MDAGFNILVNFTNPEKWDPEEWFKNYGKSHYEAAIANKLDYQKKRLKIGRKEVILLKPFCRRNQGKEIEGLLETVKFF